MSESHILSAYSFKDVTKPLELKTKEASLELKNEGLCWVHMDVNNPKTATWLKREVNYLDQIIIDALLADETRPRLVEYPNNGSLIILRGVNLNENKPEDMVSVRMWIDPERIITVQRRSIKGIKDIETKIKGGKSFANAGEFVAELCYEMSDHLQLVIDDLAEMTDEIEEKILERVFDEVLREDVITVKKQAIMLKRHMSPQKEVLNRLRNSTQSWMTEIDRRNIQESFEHITRYIEDLDEIKERSHVVHDEMANIISRKLHKNMYVLSVITAIFMPLTFVTGLFGMNVGGIPFSSNQFGFWAISSALFILVAIQIASSARVWMKN